MEKFGYIKRNDWRSKKIKLNQQSEKKIKKEIMFQPDTLITQQITKNLSTIKELSVPDFTKMSKTVTINYQTIIDQYKDISDYEKLYQRIDNLNSQSVNDGNYIYKLDAQMNHTDRQHSYKELHQQFTEEMKYIDDWTTLQYKTDTVSENKIYHTTIVDFISNHWLQAHVVNYSKPSRKNGINKKRKKNLQKETKRNQKTKTIVQ